MRRPRSTWAAALVLGLALAACGDDDAPPDPDGDAACAEAGEDGHVTIVAEDLAWDVDCVVVPADGPVTIEVDNRDDGVNHNLHLTDAPGEPTTELEAGPVLQQLEVELPAGRYRFVCDIHPTMVGSLEAVRQSVPTGG
jgi:plastocyanin